MGLTSKELFNLLYYKKLPQIYRDEDAKIEFPLKRYLESLSEGGFSSSIDDITGILSLIDPKSIPEKFFPYLCESFGLEYFPDIDVTYQRKFLTNMGELVRRRGTFSSVHFLVRSLTGLEAELSLDDDAKTLKIVLLAKSVEQVQHLEPSIMVISNYIKTQIPYYINPEFSGKLGAQFITSKSYSFGAVTSRKRYSLTTYKEDT